MPASLPRFYYYYFIITDFDVDVPNHYHIHEELVVYKSKNFDELDLPIKRLDTLMLLGDLLVRKFYNNPVFYATYNSLGDFKTKELLEIHNDKIIAILMSLWLVKDCSCNLEAAISIETKEYNCALLRNYVHYTNATGAQAKSFFSKEEFELAISYNDKINKLMNKDISDLSDYNSDNNGTYRPPIINYVNYNKFGRIDRALNFLDSARRDAFVPSKIATYVVLLEALFAGHNDTGEISYKIGHRIAAFLEEDKESRKKIFKTVSRFYAFRSKFLHGQILPTPSKNQVYEREEIGNFSIEIDNLIRRILLKVIHKPDPFLESNAGNFQEWLSELYYS